MTSTNDTQPDRAQRDARLNLRATSQQQQIIRSAAASQGKSVTEFILESATVNAERVLADRRWFVLSHEAWGAFEVLVDSPTAEPSADELAAASPRLAALLNEPTVFDRPQRR